MNELGYRFSEFCIEGLALGKNHDVLDIGGRHGAGRLVRDPFQGSFSYHFRDLFNRCVAADCLDDNLNVDLVTDAGELPLHFPEGSFDVIVCQFTLENFEPDLASRIPYIISALLKEDGLVILSGETPAYRHRYNYPKTDSRYRHHRYTQNEIVTLFQNFELFFPEKFNRGRGIWQCYGFKLRPDNLKVPLFKPPVGAEELQAIAEVFESRWIGLGPKTAAFEERFAAYVGTQFAIGVNSCTAALHLALEALDITGWEVIVPAITFVSTAHAVVYNAGIPVFADVDPETLCLDVDDLERKITPNTKAIVPVHLGGHPCDMDPIMALAEKHNLAIVEDVANAAGASYKGQKLGSFGDFGCFSFEAKKNMTTGDGGMITTDREDLVPYLKRMRWVGINKDTWKRFSDKATYSWHYEISELGFKYNMNDIQAAIGLVQLSKLDKMNAIKRRWIERYREAFAGLDWLECPTEREWAEGAYWLFIVKVPNRERFITHLAKHGITTGVHFMPVHLHPYYQSSAADVPVAERVWQHIVTLPLYVEMTEAEFDAVASAICSFRP